jgi:hypothetical protein
VPQLRQHLSFEAHAVDEQRPLGEVRVEEFQNDAMPERRVLAQVNLTHASFAEERDRPVFPESIEWVSVRILAHEG